MPVLETLNAQTVCAVPDGGTLLLGGISPADMLAQCKASNAELEAEIRDLENELSLAREAAKHASLDLIISLRIDELKNEIDLKKGLLKVLCQGIEEEETALREACPPPDPAPAGHGDKIKKALKDLGDAVKKANEDLTGTKDFVRRASGEVAEIETEIAKQPRKTTQDAPFPAVGEGFIRNGLARPFGWGASAADYDNDGDTDIVYHGGLDAGAGIEYRSLPGFDVGSNFVEMNPMSLQVQPGLNFGLALLDDISVQFIIRAGEDKHVDRADDTNGPATFFSVNGLNFFNVVASNQNRLETDTRDLAFEGAAEFHFPAGRDRVLTALIGAYHREMRTTFGFSQNVSGGGPFFSHFIRADVISRFTGPYFGLYTTQGFGNWGYRLGVAGVPGLMTHDADFLQGGTAVPAAFASDSGSGFAYKVKGLAEVFANLARGVAFGLAVYGIAGSTLQYEDARLGEPARLGTGPFTAIGGLLTLKIALDALGD